MFHEIVRICRTLERKFKDPANNEMSITMMLWYYWLKQIQALSWKKVLIEVPFPIENSSEPPGRIAVIVHCYYLDLLDELIDHIIRIPYPYRLLVSTDTPEKQSAIEEKLEARKVAHFEVRRAENRGRDIAPKYITFRDVYAECDYFLHLHGKKSPHRLDGAGDLWRKYLLHSLLGSPEIIASVFALLKDPRIGLVFPDPYEPDLPQLRWAANYEVSAALANRLGIKIAKDNCPLYPAGSMFWAKSSVVRPLLDLNLQFEDFPPESGRVDAVPSHAMEWMIAPVALAQGLHGQRTITANLQRPRKTIQVQSAAQVPEAITECLRNEEG